MRDSLRGLALPALLAAAAAAAVLVTVSGCSADPESEAGAGASYVDTGRQLPLPETGPELIAEGLDAAWARALTLHAGVPWELTQQTWDGRTPGCPDLYLGAPEDEDRLEGEAPGGQHWRDACTPAEGPHFRGHLWWDAALTATGRPEEPAGQQLSARRSLVGTGAVSTGGESDALSFALDGTAEDQWTLITVGTGEEADRSFTWSSSLAGSVSGSLVDSSEAAGRFRTDTYRYVAGPGAPSLELRTETYLYEPVLAGAFDSFGAELSWVGEGAAGPDDCALEPRGWIGVRDPEAYWYDLRFLPLDGELEPAACDGCGELYVRGIEEVSLGTVCPDWSWAGLEPPEVAASRWTWRTLDEEVSE